MKRVVFSLVAMIAISVPLFAQSKDGKPCDRTVYGSTTGIDTRGPEVPPDDRIILAHFIVDLSNPYRWCGWDVSYRWLGPTHSVSTHGAGIQNEEYVVVAKRGKKIVRYHLSDTRNASVPGERSIKVMPFTLWFITHVMSAVPQHIPENNLKSGGSQIGANSTTSSATGGNASTTPR